MADATGYPYGTVIEHPFIRGLFYMVICGGPREAMNEMLTVVLRESTIGAANKNNAIVVCNGYKPRNDQYDWLVIDD